jgi:hypothetical protein
MSWGTLGWGDCIHKKSLREEEAVLLDAELLVEYAWVFADHYARS